MTAGHRSLLHFRSASRARLLGTLASAFALGAVAVAGYAPFHTFFLTPLALALLFALWGMLPRPGAAAAAGFAFGLGLFGVGVSWIWVSLHVFGGMPASLAALATLLFCAVLALFPALVGWLQAMVPVLPLLRMTLLIPGLWVTAEWLRGWLFTGFPWLAVGYSQIPKSPLAGYAPVVGIYGVGLAVAATAGLAAAVLLAATRRLRPSIGLALGAAMGVVLWLAAGALKGVSFTWPVTEPVKVSLIQGNVPQALKWQQEQVEATLRQYLELVRKASGTLVILPETALPLFYHQVPEAYWNELTAAVASRGGDLLVGVPEMSDAEGTVYYNSVVSRGNSPVQAYRKSHLVPFGEFVPPGFGWAMKTLHIPLTDFSRGDPWQRPLQVAGQRVAVNICYEDAFGEEIIRQLPEATLLANVSNDAWFGDSFALWQHLQMSQARALETGRYMLRATNTGVTAVIDLRGRVVAQAPVQEEATVEAEVRGYGGETPYVRWGNAPALLLALAACAAALLSRPRQREPL
jgi:apolipoprotein N-acyltransferase